MKSKLFASLALFGLLQMASAAPSNTKTESFAGIGAFLTQANNKTIIDGVVANGPAQRAGLAAGDTLIRVGGQNMVGLSLDAVMKNIRGENGSVVDIDVARATGPASFNLARINLTLTSVSIADQKSANLQQVTTAAINNGANAQGLLGLYMNGQPITQSTQLNKGAVVTAISTSNFAPKQAQPTPSTPVTVQEAGLYKAQIVDAQGAIIMSLPERYLNKGDMQIGTDMALGKGQFMQVIKVK